MNGLLYKKSSYSCSDNCVEIALRPDGYISIRNTRDRAHKALVFTADEWRAFLQAVQVHKGLDGPFRTAKP